MGEFRADFQVVDGLAEPGIWAARMPLDSARRLYANVRVSVFERGNDTYVHVEEAEADAFRRLLSDVERTTPSSYKAILTSCSNDAYPVLRAHCEATPATVFRPTFR